MRIIGHRGAAGLALENTTESIKSAIKAGVDAIEIDVRLTKDKHFVVIHDKTTDRISTVDAAIHETTLAELKEVSLHNGKTIPTLHEAIKAAGETPLIIEAKDNEWARPLAMALKRERGKNISVISFGHRELMVFSLLTEGIPVYALERTNAFEVIRTAKTLGFTGVDLNFWVLNPLVYWWARRNKLDIIVYTVNNRWIARYLRILYPHISITTDVPDQMAFLSKKKHTRQQTQQLSKRKQKKRRVQANRTTASNKPANS